MPTAASSAWTRAALGISAVALAFGAATNAHALEIGCTPAANLPEFRKKMTDEGQVPVAQFYSDVSGPGSKTAKLAETIISMHPKTRIGHRMHRADDGGMCVTTNMKDIQILDASKEMPDINDYLQIAGANNEKTGVNRIIFGLAKNEKQLPLLRAQEHFSSLGVNVHTYVVANKTTGEGNIVAASTQGSHLPQYSKGIPGTGTAGVKYGARLTASGEAILAQSIAGVTPPVTTALANNGMSPK